MRSGACLALLTATAACGVPGDQVAALPISVSVVALGDSVTVGDSPDFDGGSFGAGSWAAYADGAPIDVQGGWAHNGATTGDVVAGGDAPVADVVVLMAGTNDVLQGVPEAVTQRNLRTLAARSDVAVVVLCSVVPSAPALEATVRYNADLADLADREGWEFVDCARPVRAEDGGWRPGASSDGVHPTVGAARLIGATVREHLLALRSAGRLSR